MNPIARWISGLLRGPRASELLEKCGINPRHYWLLADLFALLSERGEMLDQLGRDGVALDMAAKVYCVLSAVISIMLIAAHASLPAFLTAFLFYTAFLMISVLISETANSLVNPSEGLVLAHQPIDGATYTAAKLSHLARIILYLTPALNIIPALAGLLVKGASWTYPLLHLSAAFALAAVEALICCAVFGWLIRFVPVRRLKAAGQMVGALPFMTVAWMGPIEKQLAKMNVRAWVPTQPAARWALAGTIIIAAIAGIVLGLRALSADYLLRVSGLMRGGAHAGSQVRRSIIGELISRYFGGQSGRAGFAYVSRMMLRDWQFRRQMIPLLFPVLFGFGAIVKAGWPPDPFARGFSPIHLLPHIIGVMLFLICTQLPFGSDYKGAWIFSLAPSRAMDGFASGVYGLLWIVWMVIPHLILIPLLAWLWGPVHALLFIAYSLAAASIYLALEIRLVDEVPFSKQVDPARGATLLPLMMLGGLIVAAAVGVQYFLIFHSPAIVPPATAVLAVAGWFLTRMSLSTMTANIRYHLGVASAETGRIYKEVG
jgi:hypothetical protein